MSGEGSEKNLGAVEREELLETLEARFEENMSRHENFRWARVRSRLESDPEKLWSLGEMERTGGEPDVVGRDEKTGGISVLRLLGGEPGRAPERLLRRRSAGSQEEEQA